MCEPMTLAVAGMAIATASAGASYMQQQQMANKQEAAVNANYAQQMESYKEQQVEVNKQAVDEMGVRQRQAMIESSRIKASSGESGLAGISTERTINESDFNLGTDITSIEGNRMSSQKQLYSNAKGIRAGSQTQMAQIQRPSLIGTGLQIAGGGLDGATSAATVKAFKGSYLPDGSSGSSGANFNTLGWLK
jgi:hypothetical protein